MVEFQQGTDEVLRSALRNSRAKSEPKAAPPTDRPRIRAPPGPPRSMLEAWAAKAEPPAKGSAVYGVVDTTFAVVNQGLRAVHQLLLHGVGEERIRYRTVPGFKDLGVAARQLLDEGCDIVIACGMAGSDPIDTQCAQDASIGLQMCQQATAKPVLEVIVHMNEAQGAELVAVVDNRVREHATNAFWMMEAPHHLILRSGTGQRQGFADVGSIEEA